MIKHLRVWETEYKTHPTHNGVVTQGFFDYPTDIYNKLKKDTEQFKYGTTFRIEQEYPKGKWVFLCLMDVKVPLQNENLTEDCYEMRWCLSAERMAALRSCQTCCPMPTAPQSSPFRFHR